MQTKHVKILSYAAIWGVSTLGAYWWGTHNAPVVVKPELVGARGRANSDRGAQVLLNGRVGANGLPGDDGAERPRLDAAGMLKDLLAMKGTIDPDLLLKWAAAIDPSQFGDFLKALQELPSGGARDALLGAMINSWAQREPESFLKAHGGVTNPSARETGVAGALKALAEKDPKAALAWLSESNEAVPNNILSRRIRSAVEGFATNDPEGAAKYVVGLGQTTLADQQMKRQSLNTMADTLAGQGKFDDAVKLFAQMPADARNTATARLMDRWAEASPAEASQFVAAVTDPALRAVYSSEVAATWARNDPQAAATWASQVDQATAAAGGERPGAILADTVRTWSRYDLNGPAAYLNQLPPSPVNDPAVVTFALRASQVDAATAMNWAGAIFDPAMRERATGAAAIRAIVADPAGAAQFIAGATGLSSEQKQWLTQLPTDNPQQLARQAWRMGENFVQNPTRPPPWNPNAPAPTPQARGTPPPSIGGQLGTRGFGGRGFGRRGG